MLKKKCSRCGEEFEQRKMGRPRIYCPLCTPRKPEDVAASNERLWREQEKDGPEQARHLRESIKQYRETINANRRKAGLPPF
jgi:uncharacterized Zn finger protein (UPF0148 family)